MDDQSQSLDALLQFNQDFSVPDQLFDDSEIGVEDIYNTVEIETSEALGSYKSDSTVNDSNHAMIIPTEPAADTAVSFPLPQVPLSNQETESSSNIGTSSLSLVTSKPTEAQSNQPIPLATQTSTNHAPLKMVSVPVNSDVITQGNSQVVLIPMGGMDSSKLESSLKVPLGQKLVIIEPQEILKTIEEQKSHKGENPAVVGLTIDQGKNLAMTQQGIVLQGTQHGGFQHIPLSQVSKHIAVTSAPAPVRKGLPKLAPKSVLMSQSVQGANSNNPSQRSVTTKMQKATMVPTVRQQTHTNLVSGIAGNVGQAPRLNSNSTLRLQLMANQVSQPPRQAGKMNTGQQVDTIQQELGKTFQNVAAGSVAITTPKMSVNKVGIVRPQGSNSRTSIQPQLTPGHLPTSSNHVGVMTTNPTIPQTSLTTSQTSLTTSQTSLTSPQTSSTTSQTSLVTSQTSLTISQTSSTNSPTSSATSQTSLTIPRTTLATSKQLSTTAIIEKTSTSFSENTHSDKPNLYQKLKQTQSKLVEGSSVANKNSQASTSQVQTETQGGKSTVNIQSNIVQQPQNHKAQNVTPVTKNPSQKIVVTYVSPRMTEKAAQKLGDTSQSGDIIQIPTKVALNEQKESTPAPSGRVLNATNSSVPKPSTDGTISPVTSGQQPKMISKILRQVKDIKAEDSLKNVNLPSTTAMPSMKSPSSEKQPKSPSIEDDKTTSIKVVPKRGRPRKNQQPVTNAQNVKKPFSGPTLKHELDRQERGFSGRLKTARLSEHQLKPLKYKRVSSTNSWTCALCGKVSFADSLGCLYGPYDVSGDIAKEGGDVGAGDGPPVKRRRDSSDREDGSPRKTERELWFHGDCIVWSPGVYIAGESLAGYKQVVNDAQSRKCDRCGCFGATLVCLQRACKKQYHFFCAKKTGCVFEESNYTIQCAKHVK